MKIAVIGAGSTYLPELIEGFISRKASLPVTEFVLMDIDHPKLNIVGGLAQRMVKAAGHPAQVRLTMDLDDALTGAAYVLAQIRVGRLPARVLDETIPARFGFIGQETTGMGGLFNGLRTVPVMMHIASRMAALCPQAFMINFSNPSGIVAEALLNYTGVRMVGLCNAPINMIRDARHAVGFEDAQVEYVGLNHLSWVTAIRHEGKDYLKEALDQGASFGNMKNIPGTSLPKACLIAAGGIPSGYLGYFYTREQRLAHQMAQPQCRGEICIDIEDQLLALYSDADLHIKPALLDKRGGHLYSEAAVSLVDAIHNDKNEAHVVNLRNEGALSFMDPGDVVEINAVVGKHGATPMPLPQFRNAHIEGMMRTVKSYEKLAVEAALTGDRATLLRAMLIHPLIGDADRASACMEAMLNAQREYLPQFFTEE